MPTLPAASVHVDAMPGGVARIRLHRPERRNALDETTVTAVHDALAAAPGQIALLGSTDPGAFCAGADLDISDAERVRVSDLLYQCYRLMVARPGPVIAVVEGPAVGGGAQLAAAADFRVAGEAARFRWVGPGHGLAVGGWILPDLVGRAHALRLTLTGAWVAAEEAVRLGLVTAVSDDPWALAAELAGQLAALDPDAVARTKTIVNTTGLLERLDAEWRLNHQAWAGSASRSDG